MLKSTKIIIKNDLELIEPLKSYLIALSQKIGLNKNEITRITYALEDVLENSILFDFEPDEDEKIVVEFIPVTSGLKVVISDHGKPRNPKLIKQRNIKTIINEIDLAAEVTAEVDETQSISSFVVHKLLDSYCFINKGNDGRSLEMVIYASEARVNTATYPAAAAAASCPDEAFAAIRKATPDDALGISRLFYKCYGYSYPYSMIYYPEQLAEAIAKREISNTIAVSNKNNVIGHVGFNPPFPEAKITEWGMAVCDPDFRGRGIVGKIVDTFKADSFIAEYGGIFAHAVTNHEFTQKVCAAHHFSETALLVGYAGNDLSFRKIHRDLIQRESVFVSCKIFQSPDDLGIFIPPGHRNMLYELYTGIGLDVKEAKPAAGSVSNPAKSIIKETVAANMNIAELVIEHAGNDLIQTVHDTTRKLCVNRLDIIYLIINLQDQLSSQSVEEFEKMGYLFSGIFPYYYNDHSLILQYFNNLKFDFSLIKAHTETALSLKDYIQDSCKY